MSTTPAFSSHLARVVAEIGAEGLTKDERVLSTPQGARVVVADGREVLNFCANNYLGLGGDPGVVAAAKEALDRWGFGVASVRFICGTQSVHKELEAELSQFFGTEDTILYSSCFDANTGLFETLLGPEDAVISDELNHASIIDGVRLCKAQRYRYKNRDLEDLEAKLREAESNKACFKMIATDGVFSMDGYIADLSGVCDLADKYGSLVMVDDSHAAGFLGKTGRGTPEHCYVTGRVDILTGTLGKALGGASGGYVTGRNGIINLLRQRSRPYLFSNTLAPSIAGASLYCLRTLSESSILRDRLEANTAYFRKGLVKTGLAVQSGSHPIVPVILGKAELAQVFAARMLEKGIYVVGFSFPVVPKGGARIRAQVSAAHSQADLDMAIGAFYETGKELKLI
jgi:glycine C-acetyltransferase